MKCFILTQKCIYGKMIKFAVVNTMWNFNWKYEYFINVKKVLPRLPWWSSDGTLLSNARGAGSIYGRGSRIPHALWPVDQNKERKQCFNKLNRDFENGPHFKKILKNKKGTIPLISVRWACLNGATGKVSSQAWHEKGPAQATDSRERVERIYNSSRWLDVSWD